MLAYEQILVKAGPTGVSDQRLCRDSRGFQFNKGAGGFEFVVIFVHKIYVVHLRQYISGLPNAVYFQIDKNVSGRLSNGNLVTIGPDIPPQIGGIGHGKVVALKRQRVCVV